MASLLVLVSPWDWRFKSNWRQYCLFPRWLLSFFWCIGVPVRPIGSPGILLHGPSWFGTSEWRWDSVVSGRFFLQPMRIFSWETHFSEQTRTAFEADGSFRQFHEALWYDLGALATAVAGLGWILLRRLWKLLFPGVLLITVYLFHCFHRPYWYFHYLHFAIPLAWLSAVALKEFVAYLLNAKLKQFVRPPFSAALVHLLWAGLAALLLSDLPQKAAQSWITITAVLLANQDPLVEELRRHAHQTKWVVVDRTICAFHAKILVPPPLAVVSVKRVRSGRFTPKDLLATIIQ